MSLTQRGVQCFSCVGTVPNSLDEKRWRIDTRLGFEVDQLRAEIDILENYLSKLLEPLKTAIVKLPGFAATKLQDFVGRLSIYLYAFDPANEGYTPAYHDIDMLIRKLEDYESGERQISALSIQQKQRELEEAEQKQLEDARVKGLRGVRHFVNKKFPEKTAESILMLMFAGVLVISGALGAGLLKLYQWYFSR